ncbi:SGNH hydrolase-type esterase domain-containing protein [Phycomyces nitens]|nr:SGNH hydrolase-type esterase domain-containing protein [Phycomyces nitens]
MTRSSNVYTSVTSYQVLQRGKDDTVTIKLPGQPPKTLGVGGPYTIGSAIQVMVGDVWVMAGQSNMRGYGYILDPVSGQSLVPSPLAGVHMFGSDEKWAVASEPTHRLALSPRRIHHTLPDPTVRNPEMPTIRGASLGLAFAAKYRSEMENVPVGLIASAHGGVTIEDWTRQANDSEQDTLYGAMMARIKINGGVVAGVLWYQGESNAVTHKLADGYYHATKSLIETCKRDLGDQLPFVLVQIGRHLWDDGTDSIQGWGRVRDDQHRLAGIDPTIEVVASIDCEMDDPVHLSAKGLAIVGHRLALGALAILKGGQSPSPRLSEAKLQSPECFSNRSSILVSFVPPNVEWRRRDGKSAVNGFSLRDSVGNRVFSIVKAFLEGSNVRLYISSQVTKALESREIYVHYGYGKDPVCDLETQSGMGLLASGIRVL